MARTYRYQIIKNSVKQQSTEALVEQFNALVGKRYWTSARAAHDAALIDSLIKKGIDVSAIYDGRAISFAKRIALNHDMNKVELV